MTFAEKKNEAEIVCYFSGETPNSALTREYYSLIEILYLRAASGILDVMHIH